MRSDPLGDCASVVIFPRPAICSVFSWAEVRWPVRARYCILDGLMSSFSTGTVTDFLRSSAARERVNRNTLIELEVLGLFDLMRTRLLYYALSFGIPVEDGEDVVQETFLALFRHLQMDRSRENLQGWLFQVTHHLALKRRLKIVADANKFVPEEPECDAVDSSPEDLVLFQERHARARLRFEGVAAGGSIVSAAAGGGIALPRDLEDTWHLVGFRFRVAGSFAGAAGTGRQEIGDARWCESSLRRGSLTVDRPGRTTQRG